MALQLGLLHEALKAAGVSDELARRASEEVAAYENQIVAVRSDIASLRGYVDQQIVAVRSDIASLRGYVDQQIAAVRSDISSLRGYVDQQLAGLRAYADLRFERLEGRVNLLTWMVGFVIALQIGMFLKLFVHS